MSNINFDNPYLLFLAIPIVALFVIPFAIAIRKDNVNGHNVASGIIHIVMALIIAFVAAGTSVVTTVTETDVYVVADVSYSANKNLGVIDGYINDLSKNLPANSRMGVVCFGRDYQLVTQLGGRFGSVKNATRVDDSATDIIGALDFTGSLFRDGVIKRIVLITDGKQTNSTDSNALKRKVDALAENKIHVDAIFVDDNLRSGANEVQLSDVRFTQRVSLHKNEQAVVTVNCSCPEFVGGTQTPYEVNAMLSLSLVETDPASKAVTKTELRKEPVILYNGSREVAFDLPTDISGEYDYEINLYDISGEGGFKDGNDRNNVLRFTQEVTGEMKVLFIYSKQSDVDAINAIYGDDAEITPVYFASKSLPCSVDALCEYDEIVLSDVNVYNDNYSEDGFGGGMNITETFLESLNTVVSRFGKSLVTFGNTYIQNYGQGQLRALSNMLPVIYGKSESDAKLYTLVIDTSRSMEYFPGNLDRAKRAAIEVVNTLDDGDFVSVIQFNSAGQGVENTPIRLAEGRQAVIEAINAFEPKNGTNIGAALQFATPIAAGGDYSQRRLMLFSDGIDWDMSEGESAVDIAVKTLLDRGVYTAVLDLGRGARNDQLASKAKDLLMRAGSLGGLDDGGYYDISKDENVSDVINNELPNNDLDGNISPVHVRRKTDETLKGVNTTALTSSNTFVDKYIYSRAKGSATTVLEVEHFGNSNDNSKVPLYAYWNYGNGRAASFTSALSGDWVQAISSQQELYKQLYGGILRTNVPEEKINEPFTVDIDKFDGYAEITLVPARMQASAQASVKITLPDGSTVTSVMANNASQFNYTFTTPAEGKYGVEVSYTYGETYSLTRALHVSYSPEYDSFALFDAGVLHRAVGANGTVSENGKLSIVNDANEVGVYDLSLTMPLMIACVALYAVDVAVRKLKWEDIKSFFKLGRKVKK